MAKDKDDFSEFGMDDDSFNFDDLDNKLSAKDGKNITDPSDKPKGKRQPLGASAKAIAKDLASVETIQKVGEKVGREFNSISGAYDATISTLSDLDRYKSDVLKDIAPTINRVKRVSQTYMPKVKSMLPAKLYDKLQKMVKDNEGNSALNEAQARTASVTASIAEIFSAQQSISNDQFLRNKSDELIRGAVEGSRHSESVTVMTQIRNILKSNQLFLEGPFRKYLMKSLELKYEHVFIAKDTLASVRLTTDILKDKLDAIKHNTGLPDIIKSHKSEEMMALMRARTYGAITDSVSKWSENFRENLMKNVKEKLFDKFSQGFNDLVGGAAEGAEMFGEMRDMNTEMGIKNKSPMAMLTSTLLKKILVDTGAIAVKAGVGQQKLEDFDSVVKNFSKNLPYKLNEYAQTKEGALGDLLRMIIPTIEKERGSIANIYESKGTEQVPFDVITRRSIVEIIPGFLAKIHQQSTITAKAMAFQVKKIVGRGKGPNLDAEELVFDKGSESFVSVSTFKKRTMEDLFGTKNQRTDDMKDIVDQMYASHKRHGGDEEEFKQALPDIVRFVTNVTKHVEVVKPKDILKYLNGGDLDEFQMNYLDSILKDVPESSRKRLAKILTTTFFKDTGKGEVDKDTMGDLENSLRSLAVSKDTYVDKIGDLNAYGGKRHFDDLFQMPTEAGMAKDIEKIKLKYLQKYPKEFKKDPKLENHPKIRRQIDDEIDALKRRKGLRHDKVRDIQSDVDYEQLVSGIGERSDAINSDVNRREEARKVINGTTAADRIKDALKSEVEADIAPFVEFYEKIVPNLNKLKDLDIGEFADTQLGRFGKTKTKDEMDDLSDKTDVPNRDGAQVSGPGLYYQGVDKELHIPLDELDKGKLTETLLGAKHKGRVTDVQKAELIKSALTQLMDEKGYDDDFQRKLLGAVKIPGKNVPISKLVDIGEGKRPHSAYMQSLFGGNSSSTRRAFMLPGSNEWVYPEVGSTSKKKKSSEEWVGAEDDQIGKLGRPIGEDAVNKLSQQTGIPNNDKVGVTGPGMYWQGVAKELHIPLEGIKERFTELLGGAKDALDSNENVGKFKFDAEWKLKELKRKYPRLTPTRLKAVLSGKLSEAEAQTENLKFDAEWKLRELKKKYPNLTPTKLKAFMTGKLSEAEVQAENLRFDAEWKLKGLQKRGKAKLSELDKQTAPARERLRANAKDLFAQAQEHISNAGQGAKTFVSSMRVKLPTSFDASDPSGSIYSKLDQIHESMKTQFEVTSEVDTTKMHIMTQLVQIMSRGETINSGDKTAIQKLPLWASILKFPVTGASKLLKLGGRGAKAYLKGMGRFYQGLFDTSKRIIPPIIRTAFSAGKSVIGGIGTLVKKGVPTYLDLMGAYFKGATSLTGKAVSLAGKALRGTLGLTKKIFFTATNKFADVYRKDDTSSNDPLLKGSDIKRGMYVHADGSPLEDSLSINGPIFDAKTKQLAVSLSDYQGGLVDSDNKPLKGKTLARRIMSGAAALAKGMLKLTGKMIAGGYHVAKKVAGGVIGTAGNLLGAIPGVGNLFKGKGKRGYIDEEMLTEKVTKHLIAHTKLLTGIQKALTTKKSIREGSYEDYLRDREAERGKTKGKRARDLTGKGKDKGKDDKKKDEEDDGFLPSWIPKGLLKGAGKAAAVVVAGLAGLGVGTAINKGIDKTTEWLTGEKGATLGGKAYDAQEWIANKIKGEPKVKPGHVATAFESGAGKTPTQTAGVISSGKGDYGGKSYGTYQLSSKVGAVGEFLDATGYRKQFGNTTVGSPEFDAKWTELAKKDPKFAEAQQTYAQKTKYSPQAVADLKKGGLDISTRSDAIKEMVMSTNNQYGNSSVILKALKAKMQPGETINDLSDAQIINHVQDYKAATVHKYFGKSAPNIQQSVAKRHMDGERKALLAMVGTTAPMASAGAESEPKDNSFEGSLAAESIRTPKITASAASSVATALTMSTVPGHSQTGTTPAEASVPVAPAPESPNPIMAAAFQSNQIPASENMARSLDVSRPKFDPQAETNTNSEDKHQTDIMLKQTDILSQIAGILTSMNGGLSPKTDGVQPVSQSQAGGEDTKLLVTKLDTLVNVLLNNPGQAAVAKAPSMVASSSKTASFNPAKPSPDSGINVSLRRIHAT